MASSLGDIVTLVILATFARLLEHHMGKINACNPYVTARLG
jgi:hypothetical protein